MFIRFECVWLGWCAATLTRLRPGRTLIIGRAWVLTNWAKTMVKKRASLTLVGELSVPYTWTIAQGGVGLLTRTSGKCCRCMNE